MVDSSTYTPETIARRYAMAQQLLADPKQPIRHWAEGLNELAKGALGGYELKHTENLEAQSRKQAIADALSAFGGGASPGATPMGPGPNAAPGRTYGDNTVPTDQGDSIALPPQNPLGQLNPEFRSKFADMRTAAANNGVTFDAPEAGSLGNVRTPEQQAELYAQGRTAPGPIVTGSPNSNHLTGRALDVVPTNGTSPKQIGDVVAALTRQPQFAGTRSGATFSNLYDPLHVELNKPQGVQVASTNPAIGVPQDAPAAPVGAPPVPPQAATAPPQQVAQNAPSQQGQPPNNRAAAIAALLNPWTPPQLATALASQINPSYGFQTLPDGTVLRTDPKSGAVAPAYQATPKPVSVSSGAALVDPNTGKAVYQNNNGLLDSQTVDQMAHQAMAGDTSVFTNLGRGAQSSENIAAVRKRIGELNSASGESGAEQANRNAEFFGAKAGQRTLGTKQANIDLAATEFNQVLPVVVKASEAVSRTNYPDLNKIIQAFNEKTGDPNIVAFGGGVNTLVNIYARAISPQGVGTVSDKEHAREILQKAWSQGQFNAAVSMMKQEIDAALSSPTKVREEMRKRFLEGQNPGAASSAPAAPAATAAPASGWSIKRVD